MQIELNQTPTKTSLLSNPSTSQTPPSASHALANYQIIRRNGAVVPFEPNKIAVALMKAFLAVHGTQGAASASVREVVDGLTQAVIRAVSAHPTLHVLDGGQRVPLDINYLQGLIVNACQGLGKDVQPDPIVAETMRNLYDGVPMEEVYKASILASRTLIEKDPDYTYVTARLLMHTIAKEVLGKEVLLKDMAAHYLDYFPGYIKKGVDNGLLDEKLLQFDLPRLGAALKADRDLQFDYLGLQTLYDRYFLHVRKTRIELPQSFFMRVAMGLALGEADREARANLRVAWATTGRAFALWAATSRAPTANHKVWCPSSKWSTTQLWRSTKAASAKARSVLT